MTATATPALAAHHLPKHVLSGQHAVDLFNVRGFGAATANAMPKSNDMHVLVSRRGAKVGRHAHGGRQDGCPSGWGTRPRLATRFGVPVGTGDTGAQLGLGTV